MDSAMEAVIQSKLDGIEAQEYVRIRYAVESGSRAWGFASDDSDYDVRFIYVRPVKEYLRIHPRRDVIELPVTETLDINGWDLFKALKLFRSSNPPLMEWLNSPILYRESGELAARLRSLAQSGLSVKRMTYHYLSMARGNYKDYIEGKSEVLVKKYLYVLRPLFCIRWLEQRETPPPTSIYDTLDGIELANEVREKLSELLERKRNIGELGMGSPDTTLTPFIVSEIERVSTAVTTLPDPEVEEQLLNELAWSELGLIEK